MMIDLYAFEELIKTCRVFGLGLVKVNKPSWATYRQFLKWCTKSFQSDTINVSYLYIIIYNV